MFVFRFIVIYFLLLGFVLHAAYRTSSICSARTYHALKNELDLSYASYPELKPYAAEAFLSNHIYSIDKTRDVGEEFQFGENMLAKLILYEVDKSGFVAGVYVVNNKRIVIAFAGTTGKERFSKESALWNDVKANIQLLSDVSTSGQIYSTIKFIQKMQVKLRDMYPAYDTTVTGHSLGGGLAQFASLASKSYSKYKKIKAVTFNTAPMPLTNRTKIWIENVDAQKIWSTANNINFMTNFDPLTLTLRFFEHREKLEQALQERFKLSIGFAIDRVYPTLKIILGIIDSDKIKNLIYGKRIILYTNKGHSMLTLIQKTFPYYDSIGKFRHGFDDVKVATSGLYCDLLTLMERHVISYPKKERDYKFYPNSNASIYEVSIFIVNAFYYQKYRKAKIKNTNLTKYQYFLNYFNITWNSDKGDFYRFAYLKNKFDKIYREQLKELDTSLSDEELDRCVQKSKDIVFWNEDKDKFTRGQLVSWMVQSMNLNYTKIIKEARGEIQEEKMLKTGPGSLLRYEPLLKSDYVNSSSSSLIPGL